MNPAGFVGQPSGGFEIMDGGNLNIYVRYAILRQGRRKMDTTEQYIKMCEKAEEMQAQIPDYTYVTWWATTPIIGNYDNDVFAELGDNIIWLPRQDQLQEMLGCDYNDWLADFNYFCFPLNDLGVAPHPRAVKEAEDEDKYIRQFTSMEQLWLAFVMKEKYNKTWNGEVWE